ncbi:MAG: TetR/AcrR family transcriptional regulator [Sphaerobacter sp.]|nr:TetR/AcrR family transcriptional regulator [Sphaerobacter sp.]
MTPTRPQTSTRPNRRGPAFEQRRREIAAAAALVFAEKGYAGATNRDIAAAAGISPALIYWYYASKEDLFAAVFELLAPFQAMRGALEAIESLPVEEALARLADGVLAILRQPEHVAIFRLGLTEAIRFPEPARRLGALIARHPVGGLAAYFERQIAAGRIRPVDPWLTAQAFLGGLIGYALRKHLVRHDDLQAVDDADMAATMAGLFARGLLREPGHAGAAQGDSDGSDR